MHLFNRGKRAEPSREQSQPRPELPIDPAQGDPRGQRLRAELAAGNWPAANQLLGSVSDPDDRHFYIDLCSDWPGRPEWIDQWVAGDPGGATPLLVRGTHAIFWAWEARGSARAEHTKQEAFELYWQRLQFAETNLGEAAARAPADPTPWAYLVTSCRGLQLGLEELRRRFQQAVGRYPWHRAAHLQMLQGLSDKWGGSHLLMFNYAREISAQAPPGSSLPVLVAAAHIERWLALDGDEQVRYFKRPEIAAEIHAAADRSVRHSAFRLQPGWPHACNSFAFCFALGEDVTAARQQFEAIGDLVTNHPWQYLAGNNPAGAFLAHRQRTYLYTG
jgi:hypothetical protein